MRYLYLHGFASGPQSRKALAFKAALANRGVEIDIPDLAAGRFDQLTISGQLDVIHHVLQGSAARLVGSSLGGYLAALYAATHPEVDRLVLLAPAFDFRARWAQLAGPEKMRYWRETGCTEVFHYGDNGMRQLHYGFYEDALHYDPNPAFTQPALIFHGVQDGTVPVEYSRAFSAAHPNATLREVDSDHELLNVLDNITAVAVPFLLDRADSLL
jgi:pimeloyl-ACP methyl ester carboxylesterase